MAALTEYSNENYYSKSGQRGLTKDGDSKADIAEARKRQQQVKASAPEKKDPPKPSTPKKKEEKKTNPPKNNGTTGSNLPSNPQLKSQRGKGGTYGRPMPSNPAVGYSKPVRKNFKTQAAFLKALEVYMRRKNRGADAARSTGKSKAKQATDGRQYGN